MDVQLQVDGRSRAVHNLYRATFRTVLNTIAEDRDLLALQAFDVVTGLAQHLDTYDGELDQYAFLLWALQVVGPSAQFVVVLSKYRKLIRSRIRLELRSNVEDAALDNEDVFQDISLLIFQNIDSLTKRGTARLPTRISALIHRHCSFIHKKRKNRARIVAESGEDIGSQGVAILTKAELASMRFDEMEDEAA